MKTKVCVLFLLLCWFSSLGGPVIIGYTNATAVPGFLQATMSKAGQYKWFFAHASVGENILDGIQLLHTKDPSLYQISKFTCPEGQADPTQTLPATLYERNRFNPGWRQKVDLFQGYVSNGWVFPKVDIVLNKFCYVDPYANIDYYTSSMSKMEATNLQTWFVYVTIPLTKHEEADNYRRSTFNNALRTWVRQNNRILYDIADIEAHDTNGVEQAFVYQDYTSQKLFAGYTSDGGHLTTDYAKELAASGLYALAVALSTADRDGDGIPDQWEMANALNSLDASDANIDSDGDGMTNLQEYLAGTDPHNAKSMLKLQIANLNPGAFEFQFSASSNINYQVQFSSTQSFGSWQTLTNIPSQPFDWSVQISDTIDSSSQKFYRVTAQRTP